MALTVCPDGWSITKLNALSALVDTALAVQVYNNILTAAGDSTPAAVQIRTDLVNLGKTQLAALKIIP